MCVALTACGQTSTATVEGEDTASSQESVAIENTELSENQNGENPPEKPDGEAPDGAPGEKPDGEAPGNPPEGGGGFGGGSSSADIDYNEINGGWMSRVDNDGLLHIELFFYDNLTSGAGYSSLNVLTTIPFDVLKLDMLFVRGMANNKTLKMIEIVAEIAKYLDVILVAEGVETLDQLNQLREYGYQVIQGYYFSKPLKKEEFYNLLGGKNDNN